MTRLEALIEYYRRNFEAFCNEQLRISTPTPGELVPLTLNRPQKMLLERIEKQKKETGYIRYCVCKSRQSTMSTFAQALCFHSTVLTPQFNSLLIGNNDQTTKDIFDMSGRFLTHMGEARPMTRVSNKQELIFENPNKEKRLEDPGLGSRIVFQSAKTITAGTGSTRHAIHLSEIAKWDPSWVELLLGSILPALHLKPGTIGIKESTPYVGGDPFREMCEEARKKISDDLWFFIPWWFDEKNALSLKEGEVIKLDAEERAILKIAAKGQPEDDVPPFDIEPEQFKWRRYKIRELKSEAIFQQEFPCIAAGERVGTRRGLIPIEEVRPGDVTTYGVVTGHRCTGEKPILKVETALGYQLRGTRDHPLIARSVDGAESAVSLGSSMGADVCLGRPRFAEQYYEAVWWDECIRESLLIDEDFGRLLGYFMGDGCLYQPSTGPGAAGRSCTLIFAADAQDEDVVADIVRLVDRFFGAPTCKRVGSKRGGVSISKGSSIFLRVARALGIYKGPAGPHRKVCVPECIWRSPESVVREFLAGLFEADGCKRMARSILLFSKHREFLFDVQLLLLGFGIESKVSYGRPRKNGWGKYLANELSLGAVATDMFGECIGFIGQRKRARFVKPIPKRLGHRNARPMLGADKVVSVVDTGDSAPVYDLSIEGSHQFDAHGLRVHNCDFESGWIRLDATVFDHGVLGEMRGQLRPPRRFVNVQPGPKILTAHDEDGRRDVFSDANYIAIWAEPVKGAVYDIGVDVSVGAKESADWSVAQVVRRDIREQVCEVHLHIDPKDLGTLLYWLGKYYETAQLIVEMEGPGYATHGQISSLAYPYIYTWRHREREVPTFSSFKGWKTQHASKQLMISNTVHRFNHKDLTVHSRVLYEEMSNYVQVAPGMFRASTGNDDAVTALMIAIQGGEDETFGDEAERASQQGHEERRTPRDLARYDDLGVSAGQRDEALEDYLASLKGLR